MHVCLPVCHYYSNKTEDKNKIVFFWWLEILTSMYVLPFSFLFEKPDSFEFFIH